MIDKIECLTLEVLCRDIGVEPCKRVIDMSMDELIELRHQIEAKDRELYQESCRRRDRANWWLTLWWGIIIMSVWCVVDFFWRRR